MVNITIRGIEDEVYSKFSSEARKVGVPIGELVTKAMFKFLEGEDFYVIENMEELKISKKDLKSIDKKIIIKNVESLTFEKDVDWPSFSNTVYELRTVNKLFVPKTLSKFQVLTKCKLVGKIIFE